VKVDADSKLDRERFEDLFRRCNRRELVHPDPLEFLYCYGPGDREIVALVASCLAYGRVKQILRSVADVLGRIPSPRRFLREASRDALAGTLAGFRHRFTTGEQLAALLRGAGRLLEEHESLEKCFARGLSEDDDTILPALERFAGRLENASETDLRFLFPNPARGGACKRLNLLLRWMVRKDAVDPGDWERTPASKLVYPLDTHMFNVGRTLGLTQRNQPDLRAALEITAAFREIAPEDPVKYDFALTRLGIRADMDLNAFLREI